MIRLVLQLLSSQFKKGGFDISVAAVILNKIDKIITNKSLKEVLTSNSKKILIQFIKIIGQLLDNREHKSEIISLI